MPIFKGAGVAIVTPMKENLEVNYELLERNINYQIDNGTDAIIIAGTTGESATLSEEEHKKVVKAALRNLLTNRYQNNNLIVVDKIELADFKTKNCVEFLKAVNADAKKIIVITKEDNPTLVLASRNIPNVYVQTKQHLSVLDLINGDMYVMTLDALEAYEEDLK